MVHDEILEAPEMPDHRTQVRTGAIGCSTSLSFSLHCRHSHNNYDHTMKPIPAGEFKAQSLAIMDQVLHSGEPCADHQARETRRLAGCPSRFRAIRPTA